MKRTFAPDEPGPLDSLLGEEADYSESNRSEFEWNFYEDHPDASPEQAEAAWQTELAQYGSSVMPDPEPHRLLPESPQPSPTPPALRTKADWHQFLRANGHGPLRDRKVSGRERDRRLRQRAESAHRDELSVVGDHLGPGFVVDEAPLDLGGKGRKKTKTSAVRVTTSDGGTRLTDVKNDVAAIKQCLTQRRSLAEYAPALTRGRRTAEGSILRAELAKLVFDVVRMGANKQAIADVLGCNRNAVAALVKEATSNVAL